jgi:FMN phosphatase YigB (HAD superfamily)
MPEPLVPVFDLGNVFIEWDPMHLFRKLFSTEEEARWFAENVCTQAWNLEFDAGEIYAEGVAKLITRFPRYWREIQAFDLRWKETFGPFIQGTIDIHEELVTAGIRTYGITTFSWEKWMTCLGEWPFLERFDGIVVSGLDRMVKPDARIFRLFCERFDLRPQHCVFIDDSDANVLGARKVGMQALHFTTPAQLRADLIAAGLPLKA